MSEYKETVSDLNLKFSDSYVYLNKIPYYISEFSSNDDDQTYLIATKVGANTKSETIMRKDVVIEPIVLSKAFFNCTKYSSIFGAALLVTRRSERQNRRSLSKHTYYILSYLDELKRAFKGVQISRINFDTTLVKSMLEPQYTNYTNWKSVFEKCKDYYSYALSPDFAVFLNNQEGDKYLLASKFGFVASIPYPETVIIHYQQAEQELLDFFRRNNIQVNVKYATR